MVQPQYVSHASCGGALYGALGRNVLRRPGLPGDWDLSVNKDTPMRKLGESVNLQLRAEFFSLLNRANFQIPQLSR